MGNNNSVNIGERITFIRKNVFHMSQSDFSSILGISQTYLSLIENNSRSVNSETVIRFAESLHISSDLLYPDRISDEEISDFFLLDKTVSDTVISKILSEAKDYCDSMSYALSDCDKEFLDKLMRIPETDRKKLYNALSTISDLYD